MLNLILIGPPGSGKGTQAKKLLEKYGLVHISTGDIIREEIAKKTIIGIDAQKRIDHGEFVPDSVAIYLLKNKLISNKRAKGFVFDGFPRTIKQGIELKSILSEMDMEMNFVLSIHVDDNEVVKRLLKRGRLNKRPDDATTEIIKLRLDIYNERTKPLVDFYERNNLHIEICGKGSEDEVFDRIIKIVNV